MKKKIHGILFTDLDGTLLNSERQVSRTNLECLDMLGDKGVVRVIATGRSYLSFRRAIPGSFPADYLIFSTGAGILDLNSNRLLHSNVLKAADITRIIETLDNHDVDYMVHEAVPENHRFTYRRPNPENVDFTRRIALYDDYASDFSTTGKYPAQSAQVIAVLNGDAGNFQKIRKTLNGYQVTRTTSPLDHDSIWMEIYPENVHKGSAAAWLCRHLGIDRQHTGGIGNDYNDIDLLNFTRNSYLVANAPTELHNRYDLVPTNNEDGFNHAALALLHRLQNRQA